ncbi:MAG: hypothetical protein PHW82_00355 [Bacteroidales bacterium]|nr:hypothetical protein [Bacteroidales bacterium]
MKLKELYIIVLLSISFVVVSNSQVSVPLTNKDLNDIRRERDFIKTMNINLSQTWLYMVKDNIISSNKLLVSEIVYNTDGLPQKICFFDENRKLNSFTVVKYNKQLLAFEEIRFSADSTLINGIMYEYDKNNLLSKQINYNNKAEIISIIINSRSNDTIYINDYDSNNNLKDASIIILDNISGTDLIKKTLKLDKNSMPVEKQIFEYDEMAALHKKTIFENGVSTGYKHFVYNEEGALVKSSFYDAVSELVSSTSYEYDQYGNLDRIIERAEKDNNTKVFMINYLSKVPSR